MPSRLGLGNRTKANARLEALLRVIARLCSIRGGQARRTVLRWHSCLFHGSGTGVGGAFADWGQTAGLSEGRIARAMVTAAAAPFSAPVMGRSGDLLVFARFVLC